MLPRAEIPVHLSLAVVSHVFIWVALVPSSKIYSVWAGMTNQGRNTRAAWDLPPLCPQTHLSSYLDEK